MLNSFLSSNASTGLASGLVGGLAGSLLTTKAGRKFGKNALKLGGVAAVGAIAYGAYKKYATKQDGNMQVADKASNPASQANVSGFLPAEDDKNSIYKLELILVKAMIAASRADGKVELQESQKIFKQIRSFNLDEEEEFNLMNQFNQSTNVDELIEAANTIELRIEIYTVSCLVIEDANEAERAYLTMLADRLNLPNELVNAIESEVNEEKHKLAA